MIKVTKTATGCLATNTDSVSGGTDTWMLSFDETRELIQDLLWAYGFPKDRPKDREA